jgi:hypothetical protein
MGIAYFITAFGALAGGPISGALARTPHGYAWWRPSVFGGVRFCSRRLLLNRC